MKPQLADDAVMDKLIYPVWFQPKIDGARGGQYTKGLFTGRSLDPFKGFGVTEFFSRHEYNFLDGEITLGSNPCAEGLCGDTSGALGRIYVEGTKKLITEMADFHWWLFDYVDDGLKHLKYKDRYYLLRDHVQCLQEQGHDRLHLVPVTMCSNRKEADAAVFNALNMGYEGGIFRNQEAAAKEGRPSTKLQELVRVKPWTTSEIMVTRLIEGETNNNPKKVNSLGKTERSSAKEGKVPNGEVGALEGWLMNDVYHPFMPTKLLFPKGKVVQVGSGKMTKPQAKYFWEHPEEIVGKPSTVKHLAHGIVDNMRMGTWECIRLLEDMS